MIWNPKSRKRKHQHFFKKRIRGVVCGLDWICAPFLLFLDISDIEETGNEPGETGSHEAKKHLMLNRFLYSGY